MKKNNLSLTDVLGWAYLDIQELEKNMEICEGFGIYADDIKDDIQGYNGDATDINNWIYSAISLSFYHVINETRGHIEANDDYNDIADDLLYLIDELENNFSPFINYMDSWYNNILDEIDLTQAIDLVIDEIIYILKDEIQTAMDKIKKDIINQLDKIAKELLKNNDIQLSYQKNKNQLHDKKINIKKLQNDIV